jgi:glycosyltransferase involved in cell wall biosynthesis
MISVVILTKNEAQDLPGCLESVSWCDDVHVFDSYSDDETIPIAARHGAAVTQRKFDNFAAQRNAALHTLRYQHTWVLILDADERIPTLLRDEFHTFVSTCDSKVAACRLRRRDFLWGTWLKHAQLSPYYIRLVRPERVRYEREVNEVLKVDGPIHDLTQPFDHYPFSKGMRHWLDKHNQYSSMEATLALKSRKGQTPFLPLQAFINADFNERRYHQKELFYRLPFRPLVKFMIVYFLRLGLLDGRAGFTYAMLQSIYEYMIVLKTRELAQAAAEVRRLPQPALTAHANNRQSPPT